MSDHSSSITDRELAALAAAHAEERIAAVRDGFNRGWAFTRIKMTGENRGKRPINTGWSEAPKPFEDDVLEWARIGNVGLRTGPISGVVVVDVDAPELPAGIDLPLTVTARTGGGGWHFYFLYPTYGIGNKARLIDADGRTLPIDIRGTGGQVIFPGSVHGRTGVPYTWVEGRSPADVPLAPFPSSILKMMVQRKRRPETPEGGAPAPRPRSTPSAGTSAYGRAALKAECSRVAATPEGARNSNLNIAAFNAGTLIGGGALDRAEAERALMDAAAACGLSESEAMPTIKSGIVAGSNHPRTTPPPATRGWRRIVIGGRTNV